MTASDRERRLRAEREAEKLFGERVAALRSPEEAAKLAQTALPRWAAGRHLYVNLAYFLEHGRAPENATPGEVARFVELRERFRRLRLNNVT